MWSYFQPYYKNTRLHPWFIDFDPQWFYIQKQIDRCADVELNVLYKMYVNVLKRCSYTDHPPASLLPVTLFNTSACDPSESKNVCSVCLWHVLRREQRVGGMALREAEEAWSAVRRGSLMKACAVAQPHKRSVTDSFKASVWHLASAEETEDIVPHPVS